MDPHETTRPDRPGSPCATAPPTRPPAPQGPKCAPRPGRAIPQHAATPRALNPEPPSARPWALTPGA